MPTGPRTGLVRRACALLIALVVGALGLLVVGPPALAGEVLTTSAPEPQVVPPDATTALPGARVSGSDGQTRLQVTVSTNRGRLAVEPVDGLDLAYGNDWSGTASITVTGVEEALNEALATLTVSTGPEAGVVATITVAALVDQPGYVYSPSDQHFYEYVPAADINADDARVAARQRTFLGQPGYLAAITSAEINDLVSTRIEGAQSVWFGARSTDTYPTRTWAWADGPLAGQVISSCANFVGACEDVADAGIFRGWAFNEPNNFGASDGFDYSGEWAAVTNWGGGEGNWNDLPPSAGGTSGYVVEYGDKVVGATTFAGVAASSAEIEVRGVPGAPRDVVASRGSASATVSFAPPSSDGGSEITGYTVTTEPGGATTSCSSSPCEVGGLTNGTTYRFTVRAENALGVGEPSTETDEVVPATVPGAPTSLEAVPTDSSASLSFTPPTDDGGVPVTGYLVRVEPSGDEVACAESPCLVTGLENGRPYSLSVRAVNAAGRSEASLPVATTPAGLPGAPRSVVAKRGDGTARLTFEAPEEDGGAPITGYVVVASPDDAVTTCEESPCTVRGLTNGTAYTFQVRASSRAGLGEASDPTSPVTPATVPSAPIGLRAERGDGSAVLTFLAPRDWGGAPVTAYEVSLDGVTWDDLEVTGDGELSGTVEGLTNGDTYVFEVRARNEVGPGEAAGDLTVTPARRPDAPSDVRAVRGDEQALVAFTTPGSNGSPISGYTVTVEPGGSEVPCGSSPCLVDGLRNGTAYTFTVRATNDAGVSPASDVSDAVTPAGAPTQPTLLDVTSGDGSLGLVFDAPASDGGTDLLGYEASVDGGRTWVPLDSVVAGAHLAGVVHTRLENGHRYAVSVRAVNAVGAGASSTALEGTPATVPGAVRDVTVSTKDGTVTLDWAAPASDGGAAVVDYDVLVQPGGFTCRSTTTRCVVAGLPAGVAYTFAVTASNTAAGLAGTGRGPTTTTDPVTVTARPSVPQALQVVPGDRRLDLAFHRPADDGGRPVKGYELSLDAGRSWRAVEPSGSEDLTLKVAPVLNGVHYDVAVRALNADGPGAPVRAETTTSQWFRDPVSPTAAAAQVAVPKKPQAYRGKLRSTRATMRSADGTVAMPGTALRGRQLQPGQAANLDRLFEVDNAKLTARGRAQVKEVARSLTYVEAITCEGYTDYRGTASHLRSLSVRRSEAVCKALQKELPQQLSVTTKAYGLDRPVVVGGKSTSRWTNRRVVVLVRV